MTTLLTMLQERAEEFDTHYDLAVSLENEIFRGVELSIGKTRVSVRHMLAMKSGLMVHLYNVLEAVMSQMTRTVGNAFGTVPPKSWSPSARREWLREHGVARVEGGEDTRLKQVEEFSIRLLTDAPLGPQYLRKPSGSWTDKSIGVFTERLGIQMAISPELYRKMEKKDHLGERTPLSFLADRRNDLAHGSRTFEEGCKDLTLPQIREIADVAFEYLALVSSSVQTYVDDKHFVVAA